MTGCHHHHHHPFIAHNVAQKTNTQYKDTGCYTRADPEICEGAVPPVLFLSPSSLPFPSALSLPSLSLLKVGRAPLTN